MYGTDGAPSRTPASSITQSCRTWRRHQVLCSCMACLQSLRACSSVVTAALAAAQQHTQCSLVASIRLAAPLTLSQQRTPCNPLWSHDHGSKAGDSSSSSRRRRRQQACTTILVLTQTPLCRNMYMACLTMA